MDYHTFAPSSENREIWSVHLLSLFRELFLREIPAACANSKFVFDSDAFDGILPIG